MTIKEKSVWVFNSIIMTRGVFSSKITAENWIKKRQLSGMLTEYPLDIGSYDWAVKNNLFKPKREEHYSPKFIANFTSGHIDHLHYENGLRGGNSVIRKYKNIFDSELTGKSVWIFNLDTFPSGVFSSEENAKNWIEKNQLFGTLEKYSLDIDDYYLSIEEKNYLKLIDSCLDGNIAKIKKYLTPENINGLSELELDVTPLTSACASLEPKAVEFLLKNRANSNKKFKKISESRDFGKFTTAIHDEILELYERYRYINKSIDEPDITILKLLIKYSNNINIKDGDGYTPLDIALNFEFTSIIEYLMSLGAKTSEELEK